uniref:hypothetical protein n=1 Tax=Legionella fairfieldensis TaxID=45064 RepID=UPI00055CC438
AQSAQSAEAAPLDEADYCPIQKEEDGTYSLASEHVYQRLANRRARVLAGIQASSEVFSLNGQEATSPEHNAAVLNTVEAIDSLIPPTSMVNDFSKLGYEGYQKYKVNTILKRAGKLQKSTLKQVIVANDLQTMQGLFKSSSSQSYQLIDKALNSRTYKLFNVANKTLGVGYVGAETYIAYEANASQGKNAQLREATSVGIGTAVAWSGSGPAMHIGGSIGSRLGLATGGPVGGIIGYSLGAAGGYLTYNFTPLSNYVQRKTASMVRYVWNETRLSAQNIWNLSAEEKNMLMFAPYF